MSQEHINFRQYKSGLMLNNNFLEFGASPDAIVKCDCENIDCGLGLVEVKCPYCIFEKNLSFAEYFAKKTCMVWDDGRWRMNKTHTYYYQVQLQLLISGFTYADFVIWKKNEIVVVREYPDSEFITEKIEKSRKYFYHIIMPELLTGFFTKEAKAKGN
jgi:hypothetical protein